MRDWEAIEFNCPFCGGRVSAGSHCMDGVFEDGVIHTMPTCKEFDDLEPDDYIAAVNDKTLDPDMLRRLRQEYGN